jgi:arginase
MERRQFLTRCAASLGTLLFTTGRIRAEGATVSDGAGPTYHLFGVPLRSGSLIPGNENDAQAYRDVQLLSHLQAVGSRAVDDGDVPIPSYLPHHSVPPIRNWPGPRIAWDCVSDRVAACLRQPGQIPFLIGCDCSVVIGTTQALMRASPQDIHVLYIDGDFDDAPPDPKHSNSAASCAVWLLTNESPFWAGSALRPSNVSVIGWTNPSRSAQSGLGSISLAEVRRSGPQAVARRVLQAIPSETSILLHFDIDVLQARDLPAAYFPHPEGLTLSEAGELLSVLLKDPRIRIIEVSEYAALHDFDHGYVNKLVSLFCESLRRH